jgi:hypothetical protein
LANIILALAERVAAAADAAVAANLLVMAVHWAAVVAEAPFLTAGIHLPLVAVVWDQPQETFFIVPPGVHAEQDLNVGQMDAA